MTIDAGKISRELAAIRIKFPVGSKWKHKKGGIYLILNHTWDTELDRVNIQYVRVAGPNFDPKVDAFIRWDRPAFMWTPDRFTEYSE